MRFLIIGTVGLLDSGWSERLHETCLRARAEVPGTALEEGER
jgi:hypothetical protein